MTDRYHLGSLTQFQSTLSMRRATKSRGPTTLHAVISIHALHEESDQRREGNQGMSNISIHALHEESDMMTHDVMARLICISIHALHEESDRAQPERYEPDSDFNPRSP